VRLRAALRAQNRLPLPLIPSRRREQAMGSGADVAHAWSQHVVAILSVTGAVSPTASQVPMRTASSITSRHTGPIEGRVTIRRSIGDVFTFYRDFRNLPRFLGDVMLVEPLDDEMYRWTIQGPLGTLMTWKVQVTEQRANELIRYQTVTSRALRTCWEIHFSRGTVPDHTDVLERMKTPLSGIGRLALALIGKAPAAEVSSNLQRLKEVMETGAVSDTSNAVAGKFD
jgi:uncharacterized membrane protein